MQRARTQEAKEERRQALLAAALDEFFERGFTAARMDDIAARADLSKGSLYLYFDSKDALFAALVEEYALPNVARIEAFAQSGLSGLSMMLRMAPALIRETPIPKIMKVLISEAPSFPEMATAYRRQVIERGLGAMTAMLKKANDAGEITINDPKLTARLVVAPMVMSALWRVAFEHDAEARVDLDALFAAYEPMLMRALGARESASS